MRAPCSLTAILLAIPQLVHPQTAPGVVTATPSSLSFSFPSGGAVPRPQTLALTTTPGATASFTVAFSSTSGGTWLDVAPISGTVNGATPTNLSVSVDPFSG